MVTVCSPGCLRIILIEHSRVIRRRNEETRFTDIRLRPYDSSDFLGIAMLDGQSFLEFSIDKCDGTCMEFAVALRLRQCKRDCGISVSFRLVKFEPALCTFSGCSPVSVCIHLKRYFT